MSDEKTLDDLIRVSKNYRAKERKLCCPKCEVTGILLLGGRLHCIWCEWSGEKLAELAVKNGTVVTP